MQTGWGGFGAGVGAVVSVAFLLLLVALADGAGSVHEGLDGVAAGGADGGSGHGFVPV